ncbi:MnmC family methyltransferase [Pannus brasiliensis CCIBt3594]|uniref:MnmC family methyltransferase n=1 Tax=Pannus brasiliensis CCIBt3594 TaxID=1427578 RepID=A0AAW9QRY7_9CHRO
MPYHLQPTEDGSYTFFSDEFGETYHSTSGAREEAEKKFIAVCRVADRARQFGEIKILDICYGLGYNTATALETIFRVNADCRVEIVALENDREIPRQAIEKDLLQGWNAPIPEYLAILARDHRLQAGNVNATLLIGDARQTIQTVVETGFQADAIFLDPFSPTKCPQLWTGEFLGLVARCLHPAGDLATYSCAASVRTALGMAGLSIGATESVGRKSPGTIARFLPFSEPLSLQEREHLQTRAAVPYRDPTLADTAEIILQRRREEQESSPLEPTNRWKKRWQNAG